eukprot:COSAG02_NODE_12927_length_1471_cov_1.422012_2_plen_63_part_01
MAFGESQVGATHACQRTLRDFRLLRVKLVDAALQLWAEVAHQALHRPGGGIAESTDCVALDLL